MSSDPIKASFRGSLHGIPYTETVAGRPPVQIINAIGRQRRQLQQLEKETQRSKTPTKFELRYEGKDTIQLRSSNRTSQESRNSASRPPNSQTSLSSVPTIRVDQEQESNAHNPEISTRSSSPDVSDIRRSESFRGIAVDLPTGRLSEDFAPENVKFSKRGSMFIDGKKAVSLGPRRYLSKRLDVITDTTDGYSESHDDHARNVTSATGPGATLSITTEPAQERQNTPRDSADVVLDDVKHGVRSSSPGVDTPSSTIAVPDIRTRSPSFGTKTSSLRSNTLEPAAEMTDARGGTPPPPTEREEAESDRLNPSSYSPKEPSSEPVRRENLPQSRKPAKILSTDEDLLSMKVRSFYAFGSDTPHDADAQSSIANRMGLRWQDALTTNPEGSSVMSLSRATSTADINTEFALQENEDLKKTSSFLREDNELAGGVEDWQNIDNADVDRYGFIVPKAEPTSGLDKSGTPKLARVSTSLHLASEAPRKRNTLSRPASSAHGTTLTGFARSVSSQSLRRPASAQSTRSFRRSTFRSKDEKLMDDAGDMLTLPRSASARKIGVQSASDEPRARRKEIQREEKWRKMARPVAPKALGGGMNFDFDTRNPKLIERTWKGIPDKWRATAWHAFLSASARRKKDSLSDEDLVVAFADYQTESSPDDVQIDIDVPRTISSHIMFRRRYRGGQRLLFRVLHAMSLHFADTGYVQGMAALAATLLAYYEEGKAFIMLVRLWELRGLDQLYKSGFGGLMSALDTFERDWLGNGEVGQKMIDLGIGPTAYGTRWYLTLFNYSIPFPAQLRVWDVFMLLGDDTSITPSNDPESFGTTLDVLHATAAALIDGMRDILMESDFENAMKVLTSWVPIKDEDLFMRVARAEWKMHKRKP